MDLTQLSALLDPSPLHLETGYERLRDGTLHVACRTDMHGCSGEMIEWWFRWRCDTQKYIWWHPADHISSMWQGDLSDDTHIGSEHVVRERMTMLEAMDLLVQFRDPSEFFDEQAYADARRTGAVSGTVLGRTADGHNPPRLPDGRLIGGRLLHVCRDTSWGMVLRSHFYIGSDLVHAGFTPDQIEEMVPSEFGPNLLQHCYNEFTYLSRFLPSLHAAEHRDSVTPVLPW